MTSPLHNTNIYPQPPAIGWSYFRILALDNKANAISQQISALNMPLVQIQKTNSELEGF